jgi:Fe(3+) dicitrate transport protein
MKNHLLFIILLVVTASVSRADEVKDNVHSGRVISEGKGVPYIAVYIKGTTTGTITDEQGFFVLPAGNYENIELIVQGLGYKTISIDLIKENSKGDLVINLTPDNLLLEQVVVSGSRVGVLRYLPGSVTFIDKAQLESVQPFTGNEIFRMAGLHVVDEEGAGLRTNIGIRGLDPDRSRNVLMLEDGIPVALAPYGEPEMYFTPNIDRMSGIEILTGNGSILFGPQTIGGVINYLTPDAPIEQRGIISQKGGDFGYFNTYLQYGNTINNSGFVANYTRKQAENMGPTRFLLHDFNTKLQTKFSPVSTLVLKLGVYDEVSNATYVGLTQALFDAGYNDFLRIAPDDRLAVRRFSASASHKYLLGEGLQLNTSLFGYTTSRDWLRQDFTHSGSASNLTGVSHGTDDGTGGAIYLRNSTGQRNRQFEVAGFEPRLQYRYELGGQTSKIDAGMRFLYERAFEQRINGRSAGVLSGDLQDDEIRTGNAVSAYLQNKMIINERLSLLTGLRSENIWYKREIARLQYTDTLIVAESNVFVLIPGVGINYNLSENTGLFAGIHKGFAPPRTKDAISNSGEDLQLDAEKSWNSEIGIRMLANAVRFESTLFYMDFSNQVIPVSESSGGAGAGYINAGRTLHYGVESSLGAEFSSILPTNWLGNVSLTGTYVHSEFTGDRFVLQKRALASGLEDVYMNVKGNKTPYAPSLTLSGGIQLEMPAGLGISLTGNYTGSQFTDVLNTENIYDWIETDRADSDYRYVQATTNGRIGKLAPYFVTNLNTWYKHAATGIGVNFSIKNLTNERYIVSRRPQGIRSGLPRFVSMGLSYAF